MTVNPVAFVGLRSDRYAEMSGKSVDLGAQLAYGGTDWPTWR